MNSKIKPNFRFGGQIENFLTMIFVIMVSIVDAQVFTSVPTLNAYTTTGINYNGCASNGSIIRARVISYSGTNATIQVNRANGLGFGNNGTLYLKGNSPCSSSNLSSTPYFFPTASINITLNLANLLPNQSITFIPTMVSSNGVRWHTGPITITNNCPINMQWYSQANPAWGNNLMNNSCTIQSSGCVISCIAMMLASQVGNSPGNYTPGTLNTYLNNYSGYIPNCIIASWSIPANMDGPGGVTFQTSNESSNNWSWLDGQLGQCRKVVVNVNNGTHWVLVTGRTGPSGIGSSYKVLDPGNSVYPSTTKTLANFSNTYLRGRSYAGTWKTNMSYLTGPTSNINDDFQFEDYETFQAQGMDGWLVSKSILAANIIETGKTSTLKVYPNPASGEKITVEMDAVKAGKTMLKLTDLTGKVVIQVQVNATAGLNVYELPIDELHNGLYFLSIQTVTGTTTHKLHVIK